MFLKSLELQGFKSFPDKTVLQFGEGITAVVGPNGSGKSNIADAIRWVLGEQSTKTLRGSRMEDVIFGGTRIRKAQGFAEVTLHLDNADRALAGCDKDEVSVGRRYYRSGESEYRLNGETVRLRDINEMFMDTGLGRDGYSMVSQGRVAELISSRSSQRRDMLEEAAGISAFRYRRQDATRKLDQAEENLVRLRDILAELESRVGPLKVQSEKAQKFIVLAAERKELEIGLWLHTIKRSREGLKTQEQKIALAEAQYNETEYALRGIEDEIEQVIAAAQEMTVEIERIRGEAAALEEQAARVQGEAAVRQNTIEHNCANITRIQKDMEQSDADAATVDAQIEQTKAEIDTLRQQTADKQEALEEAIRSIGAVRDENTENAQKTAALSQELADRTSALSEKRIARSTAQSSVEEIRTRSRNIDAVLQSRGTLLDDIRAEKEECADALRELNTQVQELQNFVAGHQLRAKGRREKTEALKEQIDARALELHQKLARAKMLEELEKNMEGYSGAVRTVMKEVRRGTLRGIHGTISQLISVEEKYAAAIETAFGASIQFLVTDNETDAKRAIAFLKENRAGRATFLPMSAIRAREFSVDGLEDQLGFVAMAQELVTYDPQYDDVIRDQLAKTAVAEDLDSAIAIAKKFKYNFKIVTLDGQMIHPGGSMTGGSRGQNAGFLSRSNEIEKLRAAAAQLQKKNDADEEKLRAMTEELSAVEADLSGADADLQRTQEARIRKEGDLHLIEDREASVSGALNELREERARNDARIGELQKQMQTLDVEITEQMRQMDAVQDTLGALGKDKQALEEKRESLAAMESEIHLAILAFQKDIEAKQEVIASCVRAKETRADRLQQMQAEIDGIEEENTAIAAEIAALNAQAEALHAQSAEGLAQIDQCTEKRTEAEARNTELRAEERQKNSVKENLSGELARLQERRDAMENDLESARMKLYDEYQLTLREAEELGITVEDPAASRRSLQEVRNKIRALGSVNVGAVEEYREVSERYEFMRGQITDIEKSKEELLTLIGDLTGKMSERFREQFKRINVYFGETFAELFDGGKAELVLDDPSLPLECNISIRVQPPGKNVQNIDLLSGGEKGLSAIALLFAILKVSPAPFCVYDEVEAALDDVNVTRYAQYARRMTRNTQFILITHRRGTMEEADILYGVTMQEEGVSKLLELKTAEMAKRLGVH
ncbi:MAG: chromosome segregation protein SMC [Clostridia bacterium]|nr:chromosome segregation protein SMC [Clostridia bacterium]